MAITKLEVITSLSNSESLTNPLGYNVIVEIVFEDQVYWLARIPLLESCCQPEEITLSYAATLKYLKTHTKLPVPRVYSYAVKSDPRNAAGVSYIFMERLNGHPLPEVEISGLEPNADQLAVAKKVHLQLTDLMLELGKVITKIRSTLLIRMTAYSCFLATLKFDKIGALREDSNGGFFVAAYSDSATAFPKERVSAYNKLTKHKQGPFSSISEFYEAMSDLNDLYANEEFKSWNEDETNGEDEDEIDKEVLALEYRQLRKMAPAFTVDAFQNGPFVINHDDLSPQNILVSASPTKAS